MADIRRKGKISPGPGLPEHDAELMEITKSDEKWNVYVLDDGTELRMRTILLEVWRLLGVYDNEGNPQYVIKGQGATTVNAPANLKKK